MRLLLDTHSWLWALLEPERLGPFARALLVAEETERWISPVSAWEVHLLAERGRIELTSAPDAWIAAAVAQASLREAALTVAVAVASRRLRLGHDDPADRFIAATAQVYGLRLLTADRRLLAGEGYESLDAGR